jgi:hypothetical protein
MLHIHNATGTLDDSELLRALSDAVAPAVRDRLEEWHDAAETLSGTALDDARSEGYAEAEEACAPYRSAWDDFFSVWEDGYATGRWPGAGPDDEALRGVMLSDFNRGAAALELLRDIAAGKFVDAEREAREFLGSE